jgi:PAS domain S-box-containing protein
MLARRLIPAVVGVPLVLGWLRLLGQQAGLYNTAFGTAVFAITSIAILTAIVLWSAGFLIRADEQRRRAEAILREAHALMQTITNNATTSIFMADRQDRCTFLNPAAETMTGYTFQEIDGRVLHDVIHHQRPDGRPFPLSECAIGQSVLQLKELRGHEDVFVRKDGTFFPVLLNASPIMKDGVLTDIFLEVRDITEEKRAAEALQEADRRKDEFLAMLAHELRNPLAPIRTGLHILRMPQANGAAVDQIKDMMEQQVHHLTRLVDDLLDVSRITRGKIELRKETVELAAAVGHAVETVRSLLDSHHHTLTVALPPAAVHLEADPTRLEQILVNLLNNAAKYTGHGGSISLTAEPDNDQVVIRVRDTGVGLSADLLPKVFDLFTQAERTLDRSQGGLGIGLTLVRRLVEMHGGSVEAHSAGPGQGSEFVVRLPALPKPPEESEVPPEQMARRNDSLRVLVVEDVVEVAHTLKVLLELWGHAVRVVHDGPAALVASRIYQPEVVLLDIGLPGMNGYDVARQLRRQQGRKRPLLVAVTGYGGEEDKRRAREAGFDCHMTKPVDLEELEALIASSSPLATA